MKLTELLNYLNYEGVLQLRNPFEHEGYILNKEDVDKYERKNSKENT